MPLNKAIKFNFRGTNYIKMAFQEVLQELFADEDTMDERFLYSKDDKKTKIKIYRAFPQRMEFFPCISITAEPFDGSLTEMGIEGEEASETYNGQQLTSESRTGQMMIPINLKVFARQSTDDREQLTDILYALLRVLGGRAAFAPFGIAYVKININGEDQYADDDNVMVFTNSITVQCYTDYTYVIDVVASELIDEIVVRVFARMKPTDNLFPLYTP